jgi:hypothetical protein
MSGAFSDSYFLLEQEGFLFRSSIADGLTHLRRAHSLRKGDFYSGFFGLSIGLERLLKVILILDHMAPNQLKPPTAQTLRTYGHDLDALLTSAKALDVSGRLKQISDPATIEFAILVHLNRFAHSSGRYANLDALASGTSRREPLVDWRDILVRVLEAEVPDKAKLRVQSQAAALAGLVSSLWTVVAHDLDRTPFTFEGVHNVPKLQDLAARRVVVRIFRILKALKSVLNEVCTRALDENRRINTQQQCVPFMHEFLGFVHDGERIISRKKVWL